MIVEDLRLGAFWILGELLNWDDLNLKIFAIDVEKLRVGNERYFFTLEVVGEVGVILVPDYDKSRICLNHDPAIGNCLLSGESGGGQDEK